MKQWHEGGRPVGTSNPWERGAGDVSGDRVFQKAKREDGPSCCPLAAAAFCWRFSSVIPIQFYGLWEFIIQLHLCLLEISRGKNNQHQRKKDNGQTQRWRLSTVTHLFEGVTCNCLECLFYVYGFFGAGLKVGDVVLTLTPSLSPFGGYLCVGGRDSSDTRSTCSSVNPYELSNMVMWHLVVKMQTIQPRWVCFVFLVSDFYCVSIFFLCLCCHSKIKTSVCTASIKTLIICYKATES